MAKKSRRTRVKSKAAAPVQSSGAPASQAKSTPATSSRASARQAAAAPVAQPISHDYVKADLIQIGIIGGALILIIIILTFIPALRT
jgi:hypothetical protein